MNVSEIRKVLEWAVSRDADRLHVTRGLPPAIRRDSRMFRMPWRALKAGDCSEFMKFISPGPSRLALTERGGAEFRYQFEDRAIFRVAIFKQCDPVGICLERQWNKSSPSNQVAGG